MGREFRVVRYEFRVPSYKIGVNPLSTRNTQRETRNPFFLPDDRIHIQGRMFFLLQEG